MATVGFIGLGNMGGPMAANLVKANHKVTVFDLSEAALDQARAAGCAVASDVQSVTEGADFVISMLPADHHVEGVYLGEKGLKNVLDKNTLVIDCSTISAETARKVAAELAESGLAFIDAPVSGGVGGAKAGTLTFICGGAETSVDRARDVLNAMGKNVFRAVTQVQARSQKSVITCCFPCLWQELQKRYSSELLMAWMPKFYQKSCCRAPAVTGL